MVEWSFHLGELGGFLNWTTDFKYFWINKQHEEGKLAKLLQSQHRKLRNNHNMRAEQWVESRFCK